MASKRRPVALFEVMYKGKQAALMPRGSPSRPPAAPRRASVRAVDVPDEVVRPRSTPQTPEQAALERDLRIPTPRRNSLLVFWQQLTKIWHITMQRVSEQAVTGWSRAKQYQRTLMVLSVTATVAAGVLIGRQIIRVERGPSPNSIDDQSGNTNDIHPSVLDVSNVPAPNVGTSIEDTADETPPQIATAQPANDSQSPRRVVDLNYVLIQSYVEKKTAEEACGFLSRNGITCTIEQNVPNWRSSLYCVVGLQGFVRISAPEYKTYIKRIQSLSKPFAGNHAQNQFSPLAVKWDRTD